MGAVGYVLEMCWIFLMKQVIIVIKNCKHINREKQTVKHPLTHIERIFHYPHTLDHYP